MNGILKKIQENQFILASIAAIISAIALAFAFATVAPLKQDIAVMVTKVEANEALDKRQNEQFVTKDEIKPTLESIDRRLGVIESALINK